MMMEGLLVAKAIAYHDETSPLELRGSQTTLDLLQRISPRVRPCEAETTEAGTATPSDVTTVSQQPQPPSYQSSQESPQMRGSQTAVAAGTVRQRRVLPCCLWVLRGDDAMLTWMSAQTTVRRWLPWPPGGHRRGAEAARRHPVTSSIHCDYPEPPEWFETMVSSCPLTASLVTQPLPPSMQTICFLREATTGAATQRMASMCCLRYVSPCRAAWSKHL